MSQRILVIYGTTDGHTAKVAAAIADRLKADGEDVDLVEAAASGANPRPEDYGTVFVAASVHAGGYQKTVRRWVRTHAEALNRGHTAFVSVCLAVLQRVPAVDLELAEIMRRFFESTGWQPTDTKIVAGALPYTKYPWWKRLVMRRIAAKAGGDTDTTRDYEYTDWNDLSAFARMFAAPVDAGTVR